MSALGEKEKFWMAIEAEPEPAPDVVELAGGSVEMLGGEVLAHAARPITVPIRVIAMSLPLRDGDPRTVRSDLTTPSAVPGIERLVGDRGHVPSLANPVVRVVALLDGRYMLPGPIRGLIAEDPAHPAGPDRAQLAGVGAVVRIEGRADPDRLERPGPDIPEPVVLA